MAWAGQARIIGFNFLIEEATAEEEAVKHRLRGIRGMRLSNNRSRALGEATNTG